MKALEAWVARDENGMLYLYLAKPKKYKSKWYPNIRSDYFEIGRKFFPEVKWEDEEPTELTNLSTASRKGGKNMASIIDNGEGRNPERKTRWMTRTFLSCAAGRVIIACLTLE